MCPVRRMLQHAGLHANYPIMLSEFNQIRGFWTDLRSRPVKFHENTSSRSRYDVSGETEGRTDMTKLTDAFRDLSKYA